MVLLLVIGAALVSAALVAVATALQHHTATVAPDAQGLAGGQLLAFVRATLVHPLWLVALVVDAVGFGLHAVALHFGTLAVVQPLLVCSLLFALPINRWLHRERVTRRELAWAAAVVVGLAAFLLSSHIPGSGGPPPGLDVTAAPVAGVMAALAIVGCAVAARRSTAARAAALLGTAAGIAFACVAALIKTCTTLLTEGIGTLMGSWQLYLLFAVGGCGLLLHQLAFQAGPLSASLPAITTVDPLVSVVLAVAVFDAPLRHGPLGIAGQVAGLALLTTAGVILTRLEHLVHAETPAGAREAALQSMAR
ncbi:MAG: DMT family transporter [Sciscionella sp.]